MESHIFANEVLMVEPTCFFTNEETKEDNKYMNEVNFSKQQMQEQSLKEFKEYVKLLQENGIKVHLYKQQADDLPDSVFPNNWFTTHKNDDIPEGLLVTYPMKHPTRQRERNPQIVEDLKPRYKHFIDLAPAYTEETVPLEGSGVFIFDVVNKKIFCNLSERAKIKAIEGFLEKFNKVSKVPYKTVLFHSYDTNKNPVYHTNCVMAVLDHHIILCLDSILDEEEKKYVVEEIINPEKNKRALKLINISQEEVGSMSGNILCLKDSEGKSCVIMSKRAHDGFRKDIIEELKAHYKLIISDVNMIETVGGGSCRCMIAEIF